MCSVIDAGVSLVKLIRNIFFLQRIIQTTSKVTQKTVITNCKLSAITMSHKLEVAFNKVLLEVIKY